MQIRRLSRTQFFLTANQETSRRPRRYVQDNAQRTFFQFNTGGLFLTGSESFQMARKCFRELTGPDISLAEWDAIGETKWVEPLPPGQQRPRTGVSCSTSLEKLIANNQTEEDFAPLDGPAVS